LDTKDIETLRRECHTAAKHWGLLWSALHLVTLREKGDPALHTLWRKLLGAHQSGKYRDGMRKLGIRDDEPPAVAAAKYHYFTNVMGGLKMDYVEESPKKVWIRYKSPMWTYPGVSMLAVPTNIRRTGFASWHPFNGKLMGCPRLGWVATKFITEGYPYDEGYFIEYDHDLAPGEEMKYEVVHSSPECVPADLPSLDLAQWPEARQLKAHRNWAGGYVRTTVETLQLMYGENCANYILAESMRGLAIQYIHQFRDDAEVQGSDLQSVISVIVSILRGCDQDFVIETLDQRRGRIVLKTFKPFDLTAPEELRASHFQFFQMGVRVLNGHISIQRHVELSMSGEKVEIWELQDHGKWIW
jgi:hypothetical protein